MDRDTFSTFHPVVNFIFFIGAILFGMLLMHPLFSAVSFVLAMLYYLTIKGRSGIRFILGIIPMFLVLSVINPIFNTRGNTVLFTYFNGRNYTWEALCYGMALAAMFATIIVWFACYNAVMTSDKFLYLFGKTAPSVSLILTMVLRFIPIYQKHILQIGNARKCIGKSGEDGTNREKVENGLTIVSALTSWALEGGIITADSMRSRGFGCGKRSSFSLYRWGYRDSIVLTLMVVCMGTMLFCVALNGTTAEFLPVVTITRNGYTVVGIIFYVIFLSIPTVINILEDITWHILRSKI